VKIITQADARNITIFIDGSSLFIG